nr:MAG TPA: hypothetical protein [Caudoviricetes sp.]
MFETYHDISLTIYLFKPKCDFFSGDIMRGENHVLT